MLFHKHKDISLRNHNKQNIIFLTDKTKRNNQIAYLRSTIQNKTIYITTKM